MMDKAQQTELKVGQQELHQQRGELKCYGRESSPCSTSGK